MICRSIALIAAIGGCFAAALANRASAQPIINVPPADAPPSISGDTVLNLFDGGTLPTNFSVSSGAIANIHGGVAPYGFYANDGSVVNISGGSLSDFQANHGSVVNISGGLIGPFGPEANSGSKISIGGSAVVSGLMAKGGSETEIHGGTLQLFVDIEADAAVEIRGGSIAGKFYSAAGATVTLYGDDFEIDDVPIAGLENIGDSVTIAVPLMSQFAGVFADGTPFAFSYLDGDAPYLSGYTLVRTPYAAGPAQIQVPHDAAPRGIHAGQTLEVAEGGAIGDHFQAGAGSVARVDGGAIGDNFEAAGARVEIWNGDIGADFTAFAGSTVEINGGRLGHNVRAMPHSRLEMNGGRIASLFALPDSTINVRGGTIASGFALRHGADVHLLGEDFRLNGIPIEGLDQIGDQVRVEAAQLNRDFLLSGTLADGTPFAFSSADYDNSYYEEGYTLHRVAVAAPEELLIHLPADAAPTGLRAGQEMFVNAGGSLPDDFNASHDSTLIISGGTVGRNLETEGANVKILDGSIGDDFDAFTGTHVEVRGGVIGRSFDARGGAIVDIYAGQVGAGFSVGDGSTLNVHGGSMSSLAVGTNAMVNCWGGNFGALYAAASSEINFFGMAFLLDDVPLDGLMQLGDSIVLPPAIGSTLKVLLIDGTWIDLKFAPNGRVGPDFVDPAATLRLVVAVPEPSPYCLVLLGTLPAIGRARTKTRCTSHYPNIVPISRR